MKSSSFSFALVLCILVVRVVSAQNAVLKHGHAHNDYAHSRPLLSALENGFTSVEVDVYLQKGELKVSHLPLFLKSKKTLEQLYLQPLFQRTDSGRKNVFPTSEVSLTLMIDFKTEPESTYEALMKKLKPYASMIAYSIADSFKTGPVSILISGRSPVEQLASGNVRFAKADVSLGHADSSKLLVVERYSENWKKHFTWSGKDEMPSKQLALLRQMIQLVHKRQKAIRFYNIPDKPSVWKLLLEEGVDYINTDKLSAFRKWFEEYKR